MNSLRKQNMTKLGTGDWPKRPHHSKPLKRLEKHLLCACLMAITTLATNLAEASEIQNQIDESITLYVNELHNQKYEKTEIDIQAIDPRLNFSTCPTPLQLQHRPKNRFSGRLTVKVTCNAPSGWSLHVPITVQAFDNVVVSNLPIAKGTQLRKRDLRLDIRDVSLLYGGYFRSITELNGFVAKRPIPAEQVLNPSVVDPAKLINKGEKVVILAESSGFKIRTTGYALEDGAFGELIRVKNVSSNRVVEGRISAPGQIKVSL
jgi:flagella basal body P-ring formation protein FlgA